MAEHKFHQLVVQDGRVASDTLAIVLRQEEAIALIDQLARSLAASNAGVCMVSLDGSLAPLTPKPYPKPVKREAL